MNQNDYTTLLENTQSPQNPYDRLINELCAQLKLDNVSAVAAGNPFIISGVRVSLERGDSNAISVYVEMGHPPKEGESAVLRALLQRNFSVAQSRGPSFCVSTMTGKVLCVAHFLATSMKGHELVSAVQNLVDQAVEWRQDFFLWAPEEI